MTALGQGIREQLAWRMLQRHGDIYQVNIVLNDPDRQFWQGFGRPARLLLAPPPVSSAETEPEDQARSEEMPGKPTLLIITNNHFDLTWRRCWDR